MAGTRRWGDAGSDEVWRVLVEHIPAIVYVWGATDGEPHDLSRTYTDLYVSPQVERMFGFTPAEWLERPGLWLDSVLPLDRERLLAETERCIAEGTDFSMEYRVVARDGRIVWVSDSATVTARDRSGHAVELHGVMLDVTDRLEAEEANRLALEEVQRVTADRNRLLAALVTAQDEERRRIAAEIHDDAIQVIAAARMRVGSLRASRPEPAGDEALASLASTLSDAVTRLRNLSFFLHPPVLDTSGLEAALRMYVRDALGAVPEIRHRLDVRLPDEPPPEMRTLLYRIAQEAIVNARKHSGAGLLDIHLDEGDDGYLLRVSDDGVGFDPEPALIASPGHLGLRSIRERAELAGGRVEVSSVPGQGTTIECRIPRPSAAPTEHLTTAVPHAVGEPLSPREQEVAALLALGHTNAEIAPILHLSVKTIEHHRARIFRKLRVRSRAEMVRALADRRTAPAATTTTARDPGNPTPDEKEEAAR